jgi:preprotein translocase subunit SecE
MQTDGATMTSKNTDPVDKEKKIVSAEDAPRKIFNPESIRQFAEEVHNEFGKIAWPDKKHTLASTGVVVFLITLFSFYLGAIDLIIGKLIGFVLN